MVIGANHVDYSGYPDCRPAFLDTFQDLAAVATKAGVEGRAPKVLAPLLELSKADIVRQRLALGVPFERTISCYDASPEGRACGACDACRLHHNNFMTTKSPNPTHYHNS